VFTEESILSASSLFFSYIFSLMFASMISGIVVTIDKAGRVRNSNGQFIGFGRAFALVFLDMLISAFLVEFASGFVQELLIHNVEYIVAITSGMFFIFMLWFCHSFSFKPKKHWKPLAFLVFLIALNIIAVYLHNRSMNASISFSIPLYEP
jgi:cytochrome bd-type quinol oxidase subunit 2